MDEIKARIDAELGLSVWPNTREYKAIFILFTLKRYVWRSYNRRLFHPFTLTEIR
jgi:hypothetical protein